MGPTHDFPDDAPRIPARVVLLESRKELNSLCCRPVGVPPLNVVEAVESDLSTLDGRFDFTNCEIVSRCTTWAPSKRSPCDHELSS